MQGKAACATTLGIDRDACGAELIDVAVDRADRDFELGCERVGARRPRSWSMIRMESRRLARIFLGPSQIMTLAVRPDDSVAFNVRQLDSEWGW